MREANLRARLMANWRMATAGALLTALVGLTVWRLPQPGRWLAQLSYDLPFALRGEIEVTEAVIVSMDEKSYQELKLDPVERWDRELHVRLLQRLKAGGAEAVVFDVLFDSEWPDKRVDEELAAAILRYGKVVLAASVQYSDTTRRVGASELITAVDPVGTSAPWGVVELPLNSDLVVRQHYSDLEYTNLAWAVVSLLGNVPLPRVQPRWINYYGTGNALPQVSYYQALDPDKLAPDIFRDKVVFIGQGHMTLPSQGRDEFRTPYTRWTGYQATGVEIQATAFLNLLRRDWLRRLPWAAELSGLLLFGVVIGCGLTLCRPLPAFGFGLLGMLLVAGAALGLVWSSHLWFPWLIVAGIQAPCAVFWSMLAHTVRTRREREGVPDHKLLRCVGQGSYGEVWLARNIVGVYHAVKLVHRNRFEDAKPFEREFRGIEQFMPISRSLPGWVQIFHVGRNAEEGFFYYIMEVADDEVEGRNIQPETYKPRSLATELRRRKLLPLGECLDLSLELVSAMDHLHRQELVHRDIKPANILFVRGTPKFADIGLVTGIRKEGEPTTYLGTKGYIAPEGPGSVQADVYSLGKVLYQAATGMECRLFPELPTNLLPDEEETGFLEFFEIIAKASANETSVRYQTATQMQADLKRLKERLCE